MSTTKSAIERLEEGKRRLLTLTDTRTRLEVELQAARRQLAEAQQEAEQEFGTSDLDKLRALFRDREERNNKAVEAFLDALTEAENSLRKAAQAMNS